jgi:hypothetical protein
LFAGVHVEWFPVFECGIAEAAGPRAVGLHVFEGREHAALGVQSPIFAVWISVDANVVHAVFVVGIFSVLN